MNAAEINQGVLLERLDNLIHRVEDINTKVDFLEKQMVLIEQQANFWKGGLMMVIALGGIVTWLANIWDKWAK